MCTHLELLTTLFIDMRSTQYTVLVDHSRQRNRAGDASPCALGCVDNFIDRLIEQLVVIRLKANTNLLALHDLVLYYSTISLTTPAPTVRPPSRIAKRSSLSMAIGVINSTVTAMLSPGITISVPSGSSTTPVTSVVRK